MITTHKPGPLGFSRRRLLTGALVTGGLATAALATGGSASTPTKVAQKTASYQATPKGSARCNVCSLWQAPESCKLVVGPISPTGWCSLYSAK
jgi:hypothetical protein